MDAPPKHSCYGPRYELIAESKRDPLSRQAHILELCMRGKLTNVAPYRVRESPIYTSGLAGAGCTVENDFPSTWEAESFRPRGVHVVGVSVRMTWQPPAGAYHEHLALWGECLHGPPRDISQ